MTNRSKPDGDDDRIRDAAIEWVVALEGRASTSSRRKLDKWLAADPRHAAAYRRVAVRFEGARILRTSQQYKVRTESARPSLRPGAVVGGVAAMVVVALAAILFRAELFPLGRTAAPAPRHVAVGRGTGDVYRLHVFTPSAGIKSIGLADGSVITLDSDSAADVSFSPDARRLTLLRGRARFDVAHDNRSFTVLAGQGSVTARGTIFDVALTRQGPVAVSLLRGAVDVAPVAVRSAATGKAQQRRLLAGEGISYFDGAMVPRQNTARAGQRSWIVGAVDFDNVTLAYVVNTTNQGPGPRLRIDEPSLADLRVSGRFDMNDHDRLAKNLARLFDLRVAVRNDAIALSMR